MKLIIAEKPSVAKAIAAVLGVKESKKGYIEGGEYIVTWCVGHLIGLYEPQDYDDKYEHWLIEDLPILPQSWRMKVAEKTQSQYFVIEKLLHDSRVTEIVCATDAGREGECIFRYVYRKAKCTKPVKRLWVSSNEDKAIREGMANLRDDSEFDDLYAAGLCRAKADWLIGMNLTRLFTKRYNSTSPLKIGRVKTPTLNLIVERDREIATFVKKKYFTVQLDCGSFKADSERYDDEVVADKIVTDCSGKTATVSSVVKEQKVSNPPKLFSLSALQSAASKRFGYTAKQVLDIAQSLYDSDKKLTTYPRTNAQYLTDEQEQSTLDVISTILTAIPSLNSGIEYTPDVKRCINAKKVEDHHAIIPTAELANYDISSLKEEERNVLYLICERLLLATAPIHKYEETKIVLDCEGNDFKASGKVTIEDGYKALEKFFKKGKKTDEDKAEMPPLPPISEGEQFTNVIAEKKEHWTTPPKPYTDGTLIDKMKSIGKTGIIDDEKKEEIRGIGTEATRADMIEELVKNGVVERKKPYLLSTDKGKALIDVVPEKIKSPQMTADWESRFYDIEHGKASDSEFLTEIEQYVTDIVSEYGCLDSSVSFNTVLGICPRCGKNVLEYNSFYSCESGKKVCGFGLNKTICGKVISAEQVKKLLTEGRSDVIKGFKNKEGKKFDAFLTLSDEKKVIFGFEEREIIGVCPRCGKNVITISNAYVCESGKDDCGFYIPKKLFEKTLPITQIKKTLESGKSDIVKGFKSSKGNDFDAYFKIGEKDGKKSFLLGFEEYTPEIIGVCPRCGKNVIEQKNSFSCESGKDGCGFILWKNDKFHKITLTTANAKNLLNDSVAKLNAVNKAGKKYYADFKIEDNGKYVNLVYVPQENNNSVSNTTAPIGKCPRCGADVKEGQYGFYCSGKCGMKIGQVYGRQLTVEQVKKLLSGGKLTLSMNGKKTIVLPDYEENQYNGKTNYQWKTQRG